MPRVEIQVQLRCRNCLPTHPDRNRAEVGRDVVVLTMHIAELAVDLDIRADLARNAPAEVLSEFVLTGGQETPVERQARVEAVAPPGEEGVARRSRNGRRGIQLSRAM